MSSIFSGCLDFFRQGANTIYDIAAAGKKQVDIKVTKGALEAVTAADLSAERVINATGVLTQPSAAILPNIADTIEGLNTPLKAAASLAEIGMAQSHGASIRESLDLKGKAVRVASNLTYPSVQKLGSAIIEHAPPKEHLLHAASLVPKAPRLIAEVCGASVKTQEKVQNVSSILMLVSVAFMLCKFGPEALEMLFSIVSTYLSQPGVLLQDGALLLAIRFGINTIMHLYSGSTEEQIDHITEAQASLDQQATMLERQMPLYRNPKGLQWVMAGAGALALYNIGHQSYTCGIDSPSFLQADIRSMALLTVGILGSSPEACASLLKNISKFLTLPKEGLRVVNTAEILTSDRAVKELTAAHSRVIQDPERQLLFSNQLRAADASLKILSGLYSEALKIGLITDGPGVLDSSLEKLSQKVQLTKSSIYSKASKKAAEIAFKKIVYDGIILPKAFDFALDLLILYVAPQAGALPTILRLLKSAGSWYAYGTLMNQVLKSMAPSETAPLERARGLLTYGLTSTKATKIQTALDSLHSACAGDDLALLQRMHLLSTASESILVNRGLMTKSAKNPLSKISSNIQNLDQALRQLPNLRLALALARRNCEGTLLRLQLHEAAEGTGVGSLSPLVLEDTLAPTAIATATAPLAASDAGHELVVANPGAVGRSRAVIAAQMSAVTQGTLSFLQDDLLPSIMELYRTTEGGSSRVRAASDASDSSDGSDDSDLSDVSESSFSTSGSDDE